MKLRLACPALLALACLVNSALADNTADASPNWTWRKAAANSYSKNPLRAKVRHTVYTLRELPAPKGQDLTKAELKKESLKGGHSALVWRSKIDDEVGRELAGAAMLVSGKHIYLARHNRITTGCKLYAFATEDGSLLWSVSLKGIGPVRHSKWRNDVQLDLHEGNPVVFGREGQRYIEVRDAKTGTLISNQQLGWRPGK